MAEREHDRGGAEEEVKRGGEEVEKGGEEAKGERSKQV